MDKTFDFSYANYLKKKTTKKNPKFGEKIHS